jgi:hypothetical protein
VIKVHHLRHTAASVFKKPRVAPRDAWVILGHAHIPATRQKCAHAGAAARDDALTSPDGLLGGSQ